MEITYQHKHIAIIDRCRKGDQKAFYEIYNLYAKAMFNVCFRLVNHHEIAEDLLQEAFVNAFQNIQSYQGKASFGAWLKKIVVNKAISHLRKKQMELVEINDHREFVEDNSFDDDNLILEVTRVREAIQQLPHGFRVVFSLYLLEGYDHKEIAGILHITESTSKSQYNRARKRIKEIINKEVNNG